MIIKEFMGYEDVYPNNIDGTREWFYGQAPSGIDANDALLFNGAFEGNRIYLIRISGEIIEPVKQEKNVYLSEPAYHREDNAFAIIKSDFNKKMIQIIKYDIETEKCSVIGEVPLSKGGDLINLKILPNSYILVKHEIHEEFVSVLYPFEKRIQLEERETLFLINDNKIISSRWFEDPDYRQEIIIRDYETNEIIERKNGYTELMPNGEIWLFCK